eukprot:1596143-Pleurochrysis_carterae.AAC.1
MRARMHPYAHTHPQRALISSRTAIKRGGSPIATARLVPARRVAAPRVPRAPLRARTRVYAARHSIAQRVRGRRFRRRRACVSFTTCSLKPRPSP